MLQLKNWTKRIYFVLGKFDQPIDLPVHDFFQWKWKLDTLIKKNSIKWVSKIYFEILIFPDMDHR